MRPVWPSPIPRYALATIVGLGELGMRPLRGQCDNGKSQPRFSVGPGRGIVDEL